MAKRKRVESRTEDRMVICWRCTHGEMIRVQGEAQAERVICRVAKGQKATLINDPHNPPKSCVVAQAWESDDGAQA